MVHKPRAVKTFLSSCHPCALKNFNLIEQRPHDQNKPSSSLKRLTVDRICRPASR